MKTKFYSHINTKAYFRNVMEEEGSNNQKEAAMRGTPRIIIAFWWRNYNKLFHLIFIMIW